MYNEWFSISTFMLEIHSKIIIILRNTLTELASGDGAKYKK
jgi:hypothetical protein